MQQKINKIILNLWGFFTSMTTAIYILGGAILLFIISTLIPQGAFMEWPMMHKTLVFLQLEQFYNSNIFYCLMLLLFLNISLCSSKHILLLIKRILREGKAAISKSFIRSAGIQLIHLGILLVLIASLAKHFTGEDFNVSLSEGSIYTLPDQDNNIHLNHFSILLDKNKDLKNFESDLSIINKQGQEISRKKLSVNHPLKVGNYLLYQSYYGKDFILTLTTPQQVTKEIKTQENQTIQLTSENRLLIYQYFPDFSGGSGFDSTSLSNEDNNPTLWLIIKGEKPQSIILSLGKKVEIDGFSIEFNRFQNYSGLKVVRDPSAHWMLTAMLILSIGFMIIFYIPKREEIL